MTGSRRWLWLALVLVAACDAPRPSANPSELQTTVATSAPSADASAPPSPSPSQANEPTLGTPSVVERIQAAVRSGAISPATGYLYRFYAQWGDGRLPTEYQGAPVEDDALQLAAASDIDGFTAEERALLEPFLLRPSEPGSYWSSSAVGDAEAATSIVLAHVVTVASCPNGWSRLDMAIPVTIWGRCRNAANGQPTVPITSAMNKVAGFMTDLWPRMTRLMDKPIGDTFEGSSQAATEPAEAGDGRLDIYIVESPTVSYLRNVENDALAVTRGAAPFNADGTSSAYMIVDPTKAASDAIFKSNVAHEFFHVLGDHYNSTNKYFCPYPDVTATCAPEDRLSHWISEASATWAEHHFVPEARQTEIYDARWKPFDATWQSLSDNRDVNNYDSFTWPLFMEQESATREQIIRTLWDNLKGKSTWASLQAAVDQVMPFKDHFRDFAVRVWNEQLLPGDPIVPRFQKLDPSFPTNRPDEVEHGWRFAESVALSLNQPAYSFPVQIRELWATYYELTPSSDTHTLSLDFGGLSPNANLDVDALVRIRDKGWERRKLTPNSNTWCLDREADAIQEIILVLSNHSTQVKDWIRGDWTATPSSAGCGTASNTIVYTATSTSGQPGDPYWTRATTTLTVGLNLKANDFTGPNGNSFLNDGSVYSVTVETEGQLQTVDPNCPMTWKGTGTASGVAREDDQFVAGIYEDFEHPTPSGQTEPPGGWWLLGVSGSVHVDVNTTTTSCAGGGTTIDPMDVQLPDCEAPELNPGVLAPTRTFNLSCSFSGDGSSWSLTGSVSVTR